MLAPLVLLALIAGSYYLMGLFPRITAVCIDASRPVQTLMPFQVVAIGDKGERGLWLGPQLGGREGALPGGRATYRFYVERTDDYALWIYCLWHGEGHNSVLMEFDSEGPLKVEGDISADTWHWESAPGVRLDQGMHEMSIMASCDNIAVRKIFMINVDGVGPEECDVVTSELFHDDFDGCNDGNFALWEQCDGLWQVMHPQWEERPDGKTLSGSSKETALLLMTGSDWRRYKISVSSRTTSAEGLDSAAGVCFGAKDADDFGLLSWREAPCGTRAQMDLVRVGHAGRRAVASFQVPWEGGKWHDIQIELKDATAEVSVDHGRKHRIHCGWDSVGGIGLYLGGRTQAEFDNVQVEPSWSVPNDLPGATAATKTKGIRP